MNKPELKTVWVAVKPEDELPNKGEQVFTLNTMIPGKVHYPPEDDGKNISTNCRVKEIPKKCEQWYDEHNFGMMYSKVDAWLKEQQLITFTPEEYNQHIKDIIKETLDNASKKVDLTVLKKSQHSLKPRWKKVSKQEAEEGIDIFAYEVQYKPSKRSITNTLEDTFNKLKYE